MKELLKTLTFPLINFFRPYFFLSSSFHILFTFNFQCLSLRRTFSILFIFFLITLISQYLSPPPLLLFPLFLLFSLFTSPCHFLFLVSVLFPSLRISLSYSPSVFPKYSSAFILPPSSICCSLFSLYFLHSFLRFTSLLFIYLFMLCVLPSLFLLFLSFQHLFNHCTVVIVFFTSTSGLPNNRTQHIAFS